jgi:zinc transport system substrate-binding protein
MIFGADSQAKAQLPVFVSIVPQKYFVQKIGGILVDVSVMVEPGASPATYEPKSKQMVALAESKIYFAIGVPFEGAWLKRIAATNSDMLVVYTDKGIKKISMTPHVINEKKDRYRKIGHNHVTRDPHIWLSPPLVKIQALHILEAFLKIDPTHQGFYDANYRNFIKEIDEIDAQLKDIFKGKEGFEFMVFHPAWGYFAQAYGLKQVSVEIEGKQSKPAQLKELIEHAKERRIKVIFVQPQFSAKNAETIARAISGQVIFANPLAEDWANNLRRQAEKFKSALQ